MSLLARYEMNEGSGSTVSDSAGSNDGTIDGSVSWMPASSGYFLRFAANGHVDLPAIVTASIGQPLSMACWVRRQGFAEGRSGAIACAIFSGDFEVALGTGFGAGTFFSCDVGKAYVAAQNCLSLTSYSLDTWYHLAAAIRFPTVSVSDAVDNGSGLVRLTVSSHGLATGRVVVVTDVGGVEAANGRWTIEVVDENTIDLTGTTFSGTFNSGGQVMAGEVELWVGGVTQAVTFLNHDTLSADPSSNGWSIGSEKDLESVNDFAFQWLGDVDRAEIWDSAIDQTAVDALVSEGPPGEPSSGSSFPALLLAGD